MFKLKHGLLFPFKVIKEIDQQTAEKNLALKRGGVKMYRETVYRFSHVHTIEGENYQHIIFLT